MTFMNKETDNLKRKTHNNQFGSGNRIHLEFVSFRVIRSQLRGVCGKGMEKGWGTGKYRISMIHV